MASTKSRDTQASNDQSKLMQALSYQFRDPHLLATALTHRSRAQKTPPHTHGLNNERIEFLGDAVLSLVAATHLFHNNPHAKEGDLSRLRAQYVCEAHLSEGAKKIDLGSYIRSDKSMRASGSNNSKAVLADAVEAIIGAVYIDGGLQAAQDVTFRILGEPDSCVNVMAKDAKTRLQEITQAQYHAAPHYVLLEASGPAHAPTYVIGVLVNDELIARADGLSKKIAAQQAASIALEYLTTKFSLPKSSAS